MILIALLSAGGIYRILLAIQLPVSYDEIYVLSLGLLRMKLSTRAFWLEVPIEFSAALAPLWWWIQWVPFRLVDELSLTVLRVLPVLMGIGATPLAYVSARPRIGRTAALIFASLVALSDILAFTNARGEFAESFIMLLLIPCIFQLGTTRSGTIRGLLWTGIAMTSIGKGLFVIGIQTLAELTIVGITPTQRRLRLRSLMLSITMAAVAMALWLGVVHHHYSGRVVQHAIGSVDNVWILLKRLTLDYQQVKHHATGTARDAAQIWMDARVWPITVLTAVPIGLSCLTAGVIWLRRRRPAKLGTDRTAFVAGLLVWTIAGFLVVVLRGTAGARFHLPYLPAAWVLTGLMLRRWRNLRFKTLVPLLAGIALYCGLAMSWISWTTMQWSVERAITIAVILLGAWLACLYFCRWRGASWPQALAVLAVGTVLVAGVTQGPTRWAPSTENDFEPMYNSRPLALLDASGSVWERNIRTERNGLCIYLANYFNTQGDFQLAEHFARLGVDRHPQNATAWFYLGLVYDALQRSPDVRLQVWRRALELKPSSEKIRDRLRQAEGL